MSLRPHAPGPVPDEIVRIARAAFPNGALVLTLRDELGPVFEDADFEDLYPAVGQPAYPPWRLALVTVLQFREGLSDRKAAHAVRARIDWKYALGLELDDPGFDHSVLCEFRARLLEHGAEHRLLSRVLAACRERGLLKLRGRQRVDSTRVLAAVREMNRLELVTEAVRAALVQVADTFPDWLRQIARPEWYDRYGLRADNRRLPESKAGRDKLAVQVGTDAYELLDGAEYADAPEGARDLPAVVALRAIAKAHFERGARGVVRLRARKKKLEGGAVESPYDTDARHRTIRGTGWVGYSVHIVETCDAELPRLVVHADTTPANVHDSRRTGPILDTLAAAGRLPSVLLADSGYVNAPAIVSARKQHGVALVGPPMVDSSWQKRAAEEAVGGEPVPFTVDDFEVDWEHKRVRCPEGKQGQLYGPLSAADRDVFYTGQFMAEDCHGSRDGETGSPCPSRELCTRSRPGGRWVSGRQIKLHSKEEQEALREARAFAESEGARWMSGLREGVEGTMSQGVRAMGMRRTRYRGLQKVHLGHVATAAALSADRAASWLGGAKPERTRRSRLGALRPEIASPLRRAMAPN